MNNLDDEWIPQPESLPERWARYARLGRHDRAQGMLREVPLDGAASKGYAHGWRTGRPGWRLRWQTWQARRRVRDGPLAAHLTHPLVAAQTIALGSLAFAVVAGIGFLIGAWLSGGIH